MSSEVDPKAVATAIERARELVDERRSAGGYDDFYDGAVLFVCDQLERRVSASPSIGRVGATFQQRVENAHEALFHDDPTDLAERRDRFYEEANETAQALGMTEDDAHRLVSYTFNRPPGDVRKEIGAAALTLASLCVIGGWDMMECAEADLEKLQRPETIARIRAKRSTRHGRGPLPGVDPTLVYHEEPAGDTQGALPVVDGALTAYEVQVLIGTTISGCNMPPDRVFDLASAWQRLRELGLIDRSDGLAIATPAGQSRVAAMLNAAPAALVSPPDNGKPVAWLCYGGADGKSGKQFVTRGAIDGHVIRPLVDIPLYTRAALQSHNEGSAGK